MTYSMNMQKGKYDIVFDGPHLTAWRIHNVNHIPVVRLDGTLTFYVLAKKDNAFAKSLCAILGKPVCALASPNLGTVSIFAMYNNPVIHPEIRIIEGGMRKVMKKFMAGDCDYAVVRDKLYKKLPPEKQALIKILGKSQSTPNQSLSVTTKIPKEKRNAIIKAFTSIEGTQVADKLLSRFSKKKNTLSKLTSLNFKIWSFYWKVLFGAGSSR
ncbi:MAG: PhnD/SsuA/transferrin family substrate-binding protein [Ectothiorhodospiraceae bacterium]|nr:PhnD/SsuA/transferrin family substrate-binding protein [Ectothiorhodospiraceae bacterium]